MPPRLPGIVPCEDKMDFIPTTNFVDVPMEPVEPTVQVTKRNWSDLNSDDEEPVPEKKLKTETPWAETKASGIEKTLKLWILSKFESSGGYIGGKFCWFWMQPCKGQERVAIVVPMLFRFDAGVSEGGKEQPDKRPSCNLL